MSANEPFEMRIIYQLDDTDGGTRASVRIQSTGEIEYQLPPALLNKAVVEKITKWGGLAGFYYALGVEFLVEG